jgi:xanthine dehydrogenase molybdopterin-binding subunit B
MINLYTPGSITPYGQTLDYFPIANMMVQVQTTSNYAARKQEVDAFNGESERRVALFFSF